MDCTFGYKKNKDYCQEQLRKIMSLDDSNSYLSINFCSSSSDGKNLILPKLIDLLSESFPFVTIYSNLSHTASIMVSSPFDYVTNYDLISEIDNKLHHKFNKHLFYIQ